MPFLQLPNGFDVDLYKNLVGGWKFVTEQMVIPKKNYEALHNPAVAGNVNNNVTSDIKMKSIAHLNTDGNGDEDIEELKHLPSLFPINSSNLKFVKTDSNLSILSDLSGIDDDDEEEESDEFPDLPWNQLIAGLTGIDEDIILSQHGYTKVRKICDVLQGELMEAIKMEKTNNASNVKHVAIKKINKKLWKQRISTKDKDGTVYCVEDDVLKEALILHHLTIDNKSSGDYIIKYIDLIESNNDFYLITEYIEHEMNLKLFIDKAHRYINNGKLSLKEYQHFIKYIMWQIAAIIHWLHDDMHCCHLNLCTKNILLQNADFIKKDDGKLSINPSINIRLCGFERSEIFKIAQHKSAEHPFQCQKHSLFLDDIQYLAPNVYDEEIYDARSADIWAFGMILFEAVIGAPLYEIRDDDQSKIGSGYWSLENNKLCLYLSMNNLLKSVNTKIVSLFNGLLTMKERKRFNAMDILQHEWFKCYYKSYKERISTKSLTQKEELKQQTGKMSKFPYYVF